MTAPTRPRALLVTGSLLTVLLTAACGSQVAGEPSAAPDAAVTSSTGAPSPTDEAPATTDDSQSSESTGSSETPDTGSSTEESSTTEESSDPTPPGGEDIEEFHAWMTAGARSYETAQATMDMTMNGEDVSSVTMAFDQVEEKLWMEMVTSVPGTPSFDMTYVYVGGECWLSSDFLLSQLGVTGGDWIAVDSSDPMLAAFAASCSEDTWTQNLGIDASGYTSVEFVEQTEVDGVDAAHFQVELNADAIGEMNGSDLSSVVTEDIPADLYLDEQGRLLLLTYAIAAQGQEVEMEMRMFGFDEPVTIEAPSPDEIGTLPG